MRINRTMPAPHTHEGAPAAHLTAEQQLRRSLMACLLWESEFYESGETIAERIASLVPLVSTAKLCEFAIEARTRMKLRHAPLWLAACMAGHAQHRRALAALLPKIVLRADEPAEFLALLWKDAGKGRQVRKLPNAIKRGLAVAMQAFTAYALAKYNRAGAVTLRDVLRLVHPRPKDAEQAATWKQLLAGELPSPDTWEVALSSGQDKRATFTRLIREGKLGALALLRNLRKMQEVAVDSDVIRMGLAKLDAERVLPFRFVAAARYAPQFEPDLETAMFRSMAGVAPLRGQTVLLVDVSGSMDAPLSARSEMKRIDAACGLGILLRELCESVRIFTFSEAVVEVPPRRGFALRDALVNSQGHGGTHMGNAVASTRTIAHDRLIVLTDEQSHDIVASPLVRNAYCINVASAQNGVGYGPWIHIDGWSEAVLDYIRELEALDAARGCDSL